MNTSYNIEKIFENRDILKEQVNEKIFLNNNDYSIFYDFYKNGGYNKLEDLKQIEQLTTSLNISEQDKSNIIINFNQGVIKPKFEATYITSKKIQDEIGLK